MFRTWSHEPDTVAKLEGRWKRGVHSVAVAKRRGDPVTSHARGPILLLCPANLFDSRFRLRRPASQFSFKARTTRLAAGRPVRSLNLDRSLPPCLVRLLKGTSAAFEPEGFERNLYALLALCLVV